MGCLDRTTAAVPTDALTRPNASADEGELAAAALLIMHLGEATMRLAISVNRAEGEKLVIAYKRLALTELRGIVHGKVGTASRADRD